MAYLRYRSTTPPGGWVFYQKETAFTIKGENEGQLIDLVIQHRQYKSLLPQEREAVRLDIERQICTKLGSGECRSEGASDTWVPRNPERNVVTMSGVLAFSKAAFAFIKSGGAMAPMEEVQRRAEICRACPLNQELTGCACNSFYKTIESIVSADRRLPGLHVCRACDCSLVAKVNLTDEQVRVSNEGRKITWPGSACWQKDIEQSVSPS